MKTVSGLGIGLSLVFGCLLLALVAEICYLLRWKKKKSKRVLSHEEEEEQHNNNNNNINGYTKDLIQLFCFKKPQSLQPNNGEILRNPDGNLDETLDLEVGLMKHLGGGDAGFEAELMKLHNQRFLFTIKEETKEDLESEDIDDGVSGRRSDLALGVNDCNTPSFFTPMASPPLESYYPNHGLNPLFESEGEMEFNKFFRSSSSSPPPKFKFLRDAEEKLRRRLMAELEEEARKTRNGSDSETLNVTEGSFLKFMNRAKTESSRIS